MKMKDLQTKILDKVEEIRVLESNVRECSDEEDLDKLFELKQMKEEELSLFIRQAKLYYKTD